MKTICFCLNHYKNKVVIEMYLKYLQKIKAGCLHYQAKC